MTALFFSLELLPSKSRPSPLDIKLKNPYYFHNIPKKPEVMNVMKSRSGFESDQELLDDYGECDPSLRCYQLSAADTPTTTTTTNRSVNNTVRMTHRHANELLQARLKNALRHCSFGDGVQVSSNGQLSFTTAGGYRDNIKISIRPDTMAVVISTAIHKWNQEPPATVMMANNHHRRSRCPYSLLTKMMKHKTLLKTARVAGVALDGVHYCDIVNDNIVLFGNPSLSVLSSDQKFILSLASYIWKATEISKDFANNTKKRQQEMHLEHDS
jgi:hypothetical protein